MSNCCIVCATRGGAGSRAVQMQAIDEAKATGDRLVFLFIADTSFVGEPEAKLEPAVESELFWVGKALLRLAKQRAERAGVDADVELRAGPLNREIVRFLRENEARLLLLGAPRATSTRVFGDDTIEQFASAIEADTGVPVKVVRPEEIA